MRAAEFFFTSAQESIVAIVRHAASKTFNEVLSRRPQGPSFSTSSRRAGAVKWIAEKSNCAKWSQPSNLQHEATLRLGGHRKSAEKHGARKPR